MPCNRFGQILVVFAAALGSGLSPCLAQDGFIERFQGSFFDPTLNTAFRLQHIEGRQLGDTSPFTMAGATRFVDVVDGVLMLDGQARVTNGGEVGGSFGGVRRVLSGDSIFGAGVWLDVHQSPGDNTFQQVGTSLEWFRDDWSFRANGYFPVGNDRQSRATGLRGASGVRYQGNNIVFGSDIFRVDEVAMDGVELEVARNISQYDAEAFAGWYHRRSSVEQTDGFKVGARGYLTDNLAASVSVADDSLFGTNVFGGLTIFFGSGRARPAKFSDKLRIPVERNHLVALRDQTVQSGSDFTVLTDPVSTQPILVEHVDSTAPAGGDGTFENPLSSIDDLFANSANGTTTNGNIAFAHSGSVFTGQSASLRDNQRFLGEGIAHTVNTVELGTINLPAANGPGTVPQIVGSPGDAIALGSMGNEVSGFTIDGGIRGIVNDTGASDTNINRLTVQNTTGDGIVITPSTSTMIDNVIFSNIGGQDIVLNASDSTLTNITSTNAAGGSIFLQNLTGTTTLNNINITGAGGTGAILLDNAMAASQTTLSNIAVNDGTDGLSITNSQAGSNAMITDLETDGTTGTGVRIDGGDGDLTFAGTTAVTNRGGTGISVSNHAGDIMFETATVTGLGGTTNGIDVQNTTGLVSFDTANVSNSGAAGIFIDDAGNFQVGASGTTSGDGGAIIGAVDNGIFARNSNVDIRFMNISNVTDSESSNGPFDEGLGDGIRYVLQTGSPFTATLANNSISNVAEDGINAVIDNGTLTAILNGNNVTAGRSGIRIQGTEFGIGGSILSINNNTVAAGTSTSSRGIETSGTIPNGHTITSFSGNTVTAAGGGGLSFSDVIFDSDPGTMGFQPVNAGTTILGSTGSRLMQTAVQFDGPPEGSLVFDSLQAFTAASPTAASSGVTHSGRAEDFFLTINGGVIDIADGESFTRGIQFGPLFISNTFGPGDGGLTLNNLNINLNGDPDPTAIQLGNNATTSGTATALSGSGNTTTGVTTFKNVQGSNFTGSIEFNGGANSLP